MVGGGFCNESDLKPWDLQFQQLIWKMLLKTPEQSISAWFSQIQSYCTHTVSLFCIRKTDASFKWADNTLSLSLNVFQWVCSNYQHIWLTFPTVLRTKLDLFSHLLGISFAYLLVLCTWEKHTVLHFWPLEQFSLFPPFLRFQQFYQSKFGTIVFLGIRLKLKSPLLQFWFMRLKYFTDDENRAIS